MENTDIDFTYADLDLVKGIDKLNGELMDTYFIEQVGHIECRDFINKPYFASIFEVDNSFTDLNSVSLSMYGQLNHFIENLWFSKDCCPTLNAIYFYIPSQKRIVIRRNYSRPSNSKGVFLSHQINADDLMLAEEISLKFHRELKFKNSHSAQPVSEIIHKADVPPNYFIEYNTTQRLEKCMLFLSLARHQARLPVKIALYMSILECLFTSDSVELNHKVAERAAIYLNTTKEQAYDNFKTIKLAYDYRSKFLHGQNLKKKKDNYESLSEIASSIDELLRKILKKAILEDFDLFNSFDGSDIDNYFNEKIFKKQ